MSELVHIIHPDLPRAPASVQARAAYERTFKDKGWILLPEKDAAKHNQAIARNEPSPFLEKVSEKAVAKAGER